MIEYGALVTKHDQLFETKWIREQRAPDEIILGNSDPSSLADLGSSYTIVRHMTLVPITKPTLITLAVAAALPMLPVVMLTTPTGELVHIVVKMLA
jgi:hypothetical protein